MSTETGARKSRLSRSTSESEAGAVDTASNTSEEDSDTTKHTDEQEAHHISSKDGTQDVRELPERHQESGKDTAVESSATTLTSSNATQNLIPGDGSRQIIAVSANKNPTAFFQLARKFLMTNEMCDLSALEGAIVSAVDAAHLLERSKLATIVRVHTSYVNVEPKRRRHQKGEESSSETTTKDNVSSTQTSKEVSVSAQPESLTPTSTDAMGMKTKEKSSASSTQSRSASERTLDDKSDRGSMQEKQQVEQSSPAVKAVGTTGRGSASSGGGSRELRRARILVTVKRTESYKRWLEENPIQRQAIIAGTANVTAEEIAGEDSPLPPSSETKSSSPKRIQ